MEKQHHHSHHHDSKHAHDHDQGIHDHYHPSQFSSESKLLIVFLLNLIMSVIEFFGGLSTNSTAILSDALHDFGDSIALGIGYFLEKVSKKKGDGLFSFGYRRFSLLSALFSSIVLLVGSTLILTEVIPRLFSPEAVNHKGMLALAFLGVIVNGFSFWYLHRTSHSINEKVISLHMLEDLLGWVAVLIVSGILFFKNVPILDPILSLIITSVILVNVYKNLKKIFYILLQGVPREFDSTRIEKVLLSHPSVQSVYHVHVWSLDGEKHVLTANVVLKSDTSMEAYTAIQNWMREEIQKHGLWHSTLEIELTNSSQNC